MAAIDFPASPALNQLYTAPSNGVSYIWTGVVWTTYAPARLSPVNAETFDVSSAGQASGVNFWAGGDTAMQIANGAQIFSRSFTAADPTHRIEVDAYVQMQAPNSATAHGVIGLFIDGAANAVAQMFITVPAGSSQAGRVYWQGILAVGPHTFALRFGSLSPNGIYTIMSDAGHGGGGAMRNTMTMRELGQ
jgi:hypothetical protein